MDHRTEAQARSSEYLVLHNYYYRAFACKRKVELSHLSKVRMSPCLFRKGVGRHGMGADERARSSPG